MHALEFFHHGVFKLGESVTQWSVQKTCGASCYNFFSAFKSYYYVSKSNMIYWLVNFNCVSRARQVVKKIPRVLRKEKVLRIHWNQTSNDLDMKASGFALLKVVGYIQRMNTLGARGFFLVGGDRIERRSGEGESLADKHYSLWSSSPLASEKTSGIQGRSESIRLH